MGKKADLAAVLADLGGGTRKRPEPVQAETSYTIRQSPSREGTKPITVHFPKDVRDQLKILAVEKSTTMHNLLAEALNDLFAKYGKPEIAPRE
jgi:antitoxin-like ribbon-helix-helix protein